MRIAALADIHGNLLALEAAIADLREMAPDLVVDLGDHLSGPLQAGATADLLLTQAWVSIRGNHDRHLVEREPEKMSPADRAAHEQLTETHRIWLRSLPATRDLDGSVRLCHGSPRSDMVFLLEDFSEAGIALAPREAIETRLDPGPDLVLCAHSHIPRIVALANGMTVVNPGSIGLQAFRDDKPFPYRVELGSPHARYAVLDQVGRSWRVTFRTVEYDWQAASAIAGEAERPDWAHALATGYVLR
ncbi:MAG: metallophosphoesterase family protein [Bryobacteraceae bacterium]